MQVQVNKYSGEEPTPSLISLETVLWIYL